MSAFNPTKYPISARITDKHPGNVYFAAFTELRTIDEIQAFAAEVVQGFIDLGEADPQAAAALEIASVMGVRFKSRR